jgi:predicted permease
VTLLLQTLFPVFSIIILGYVLVRKGFFDAHTVRGLNSLIYWVGMPALLILRLIRADFSMSGFFWITVGLVSSSLLVIFFAWVAARLSRLPREYVGTYLQAAFRGNIAFIALPVISLTFIPYGKEVSQLMETLTIMALASSMLFYNVASTLVLIAGRPSMQTGRFRRLFYPLLKNPILLSSAFGVVIGWVQLPIPNMFLRTLETLTGAALPLALLCIGCSLYLTPLRGKIRYALMASIFKTVVSPLLGLLLCWVLRLPNYITFIVVLMLSCPTATVSYVFSKQLGGDEALASGCIVVSTLISLLTFSVLLLVVGGIGIENFFPPIAK